jgi:hypothetical protein
MATQTAEMLGTDHPLLAEIRELAQTAVGHHLSPIMLGERPLARASALMVRQRLLAKQPSEVAPRKIEFSGPAPAAAPAPAIERDPSWPRWLHVGAGIYFYEGNVYKVYLSQYTDHWMCKLLDVESAREGGSRWTSVRGIIARLRPGHEMSDEQSRHFEELYGITVCIKCGAELENEVSKARRMGDTCAGK